MEYRDKIAAHLAEIVGKDISGPMADRHIQKYLMEKGKNELTGEDINSDFVSWLVNRLQHLSMVKPQALQNLAAKLKGL